LRGVCCRACTLGSQGVGLGPTGAAPRLGAVLGLMVAGGFEGPRRQLTQGGGMLLGVILIALNAHPCTSAFTASAAAPAASPATLGVSARAQHGEVAEGAQAWPAASGEDGDWLDDDIQKQLGQVDELVSHMSQFQVPLVLPAPSGPSRIPAMFWQRRAQTACAKTGKVCSSGGGAGKAHSRKQPARRGPRIRCHPPSLSLCSLPLFH